MFFVNSFGFVFAMIGIESTVVSLDSRFDDVAHRVAYASPCTSYGFHVDVTKIRKQALEVQKDAVTAGMTEQEAGDRLREAVKLKFDRLNERITMAGFMPRTSESSRRFEVHLNRECPKLAPKNLSVHE